MNWRYVELGVKTNTHAPGRTSSRQNDAVLPFSCFHVDVVTATK